MDEHQGLIGVKSKANAWTTFYIRLKEEREVTHEISESSGPEEPTAKKNLGLRRSTRQNP